MSSRKYSTTQGIEAVGGLPFIYGFYQVTMNICLYGIHATTACASLPNNNLDMDCGAQCKVHLLCYSLS